MDDIISRAWIRWFLEGSRRLSKGMDTVAFAGLSEALAIWLGHRYAGYRRVFGGLSEALEHG